MSIVRPARAGDEAGLKRLWKTVFDDTDELIDAFFRELFRSGSAHLVEEDGEIVSAAHVVPFRGARYIYAVATLPAYRGKGYGEAVVLAAVGNESAYLLPASDSLRAWYKKMGAEDLPGKPLYAPGKAVRPISAEEYNARREALLAGKPHAGYTPELMHYFSAFGSFYAGERGICAISDGDVCEALPCELINEPYLMGFNGAKPLYLGLTLL